MPDDFWWYYLPACYFAAWVMTVLLNRTGPPEAVVWALRVCWLLSPCPLAMAVLVVLTVGFYADDVWEALVRVVDRAFRLFRF